MFQFPGFALCGLCIQPQSTCITGLFCATASLPERIARTAFRSHKITLCQVGCPIRKSMDQSLFTAPHGLSQCTTSFIASCCQGIHQTPFSRLIRPGKSRNGMHVRHRCAHCARQPSHPPSPGIGSSTFPMRPGWFTRGAYLVSVLDLDRQAPRRTGRGSLRRLPTDAPSRGDTSAMTDVFSQRCQNVRNRTIRSTTRVRPMIGFGGQAEGRRMGWWSLSGSNR